ncbi:hypothetical protein CYMTET_29783 [Cymbomonas tetramitiformis]|uniref:Uncharacterized protein n=1 Tax=Cymbomonas tetramitiformis TaxID=36881 RepID=A0AAE0KUT6_9CHLO|nr:hypothetical protein CYMTET_29783 [Cymbomonas tetramitiformis]
MALAMAWITDLTLNSIGTLEIFWFRYPSLTLVFNNEEVHEGGDDVVQKQAQHAMMGVLQQAAKKDMETLKSENADAVRERLAKSQKVAREILAALKLERSYSEQLEELLREKGIDVPPRPPKEA